MVVIAVDLLPLWYSTILEVQSQKIIIDSLKLSYDYLRIQQQQTAIQLTTCKSGNDVLKQMIGVLEQKNGVTLQDVADRDKQIKRLRFWTKVELGVAAAFAVLVIAK